MLIRVTPRVVSGIERGGEDLYLDFVCVEYDDQPVKVLLAEEAVGCNVNVDDDWLEGQGEDYDQDPHEDPQAIFHVVTDYYEIEWTGTCEDLTKWATETGVTDKNKWQWFGPVSEEPKMRWRHSFYVDGNAE